MRKNLKKFRKTAGMTQAQAAENLGISERYYRYIEAGARCGKSSIWKALEKLFEADQKLLQENNSFG